MKPGKLILASMLLAAGLSAPAISQAGVGIDINVGPPVAVVETPPPPPRADYVWAPGFYRWDGGAHVWVPGHYMEPHPGYRWVPDHWDRRGDHYIFVEGRWAR
jgi:hypothetical protein